MSVDLKNFLEASGLGILYDTFVANDIDLTLAKMLTESDLIELGLSIGQRKRFVLAIASLAQTDAAPEEVVPERRQITVLFADLVGSTHLSEIMDAEDLREYLMLYRQACVDVCRANNGHIAFQQGDGITVFFGYPTASEHDAEDAVRAGLAIVQAVRAIDANATVKLQVRVGVATGTVIVGDVAKDGMMEQDLAVGESLNLAARLQTLAAPDEVIVADATQRLAGAIFAYQTPTVEILKGFADPVKVYRVLGEARVENRFEARSQGVATAMFGRDRELKVLSDLWRKARAGKGQVVLVSGQPGIGKSRLTLGFAASVVGGRSVQLNWYCAAHLANRALHPFIREIERHVGFAHTADAIERLAGVEAILEANSAMTAADMPLIADLIGIEVDGQRPDMDPQARARASADMLVRRVQGVAAQAPLLMVFEDAHWADEASQEVLARLADQLDDVPAMLIVTARPEFQPKWGLRPNQSIIDLPTLDQSSGAKLIDAILKDRKLPSVLAHRILEKTDGVPLFVEEMTKSIVEGGGSGDNFSSGDFLNSTAVPATLQDSLMARLDRIRGGKEIAQLGAVIGREFTAAMLYEIKSDHRAVDNGLARLCEAGLVLRGSPNGPEWFYFNHALVQDAAYESMLRRTRRSVHRVIAAAMLAKNPVFGSPEPEIIARHCTEAGMAAEAVEFWYAAGRDAQERASHIAAIEYLRAALANLADGLDGRRRAETELKLQLALAPSLMTVRGWASEEVETACARARDLAVELEDYTQLFAAMWGLWSVLFLRGELNECMAVAREIDAMAQGSGVPMLMTAADHAVGYAHFWRGEYHEALERAEAGMARFDREVEIAIMKTFQLSSSGAIQTFRACSLWMVGREAEAYTAFEEALEFVASLNHPPTSAYGFGTSGQTLTMWRDWDRLAEIAGRGKRYSDDEGYELWSTVAEVQAGLALAFKGEIEQGLNAVRIGRDRFLSTRTVITDVMHHPSVGELLITAGHGDACIEAMSAAIADAERRGERNYLSEVYRVRGEARREVGDWDGARVDFEAAIAIAESQGAVPLLRWARRSLLDLERKSTRREPVEDRHG